MLCHVKGNVIADNIQAGEKLAFFFSSPLLERSLLCVGK
jgi:hypothetical protein